MRIVVTKEHYALDGTLEELRSLSDRLQATLFDADAHRDALETANLVRDEKPHGGHHVSFGLSEVDGIEESAE